MFSAHDEVYTDGTGGFSTLFPLIFVRLSLPRADYGIRLGLPADQGPNRQHTHSFGPF